MRYKETREQSAELLRQALALMGQHDAAFNPISFAVWYEFAAGTNARLTQAVEQSVRTEPRLGNETLLRLYQENVADADASAVQRIGGELRRVMASVSQSASKTGDQAETFGEQLRDLTVALQTNDPLAMTPVVTQTLAGTMQMSSDAQALEQQIVASHKEIERLQVDLVRARDEAVLDPLTRILNRKGFDRELAALLAEKPALDKTHCLVMLDIDHFKKVNDTHGHVMGDRVIQALGEVLRSCVSDKSHHVARYGGEEFAILLPHCTVAYGLKLADAVRLKTKAMKIRDRRTQELVLTISISAGVAAMRPDDDAQGLIARADSALYKSKQSGRDRVTYAP